MILSDLKQEIRDLGFEDDTIYMEYQTVINHAITRALKVIATLVKAPVGKYVLDLTDDEVRAEDNRYDLTALIKDDNDNVLFDSIDRIVVNDKTFLDYDIEQDHVLVVKPALREVLTIFYNERILPVTESTDGNSKVQVVYPCDPLVALLASHYVWLDDDERKAVMYWNEFDQLRQEIEAKHFKLKGRVVGGF